MSQKIDSLQLPIPQGQRQKLFSRKAAAAAVGLGAIALLVVAVTTVLPGEHRVVETMGAAALPATNPELMVADRYLSEMAIKSEAALLSANPELMAARGYADAAARKAEAAFLANNPELMVVRRFRAPTVHSLGSILDAIPAPQILAPNATLAGSENDTLTENPDQDLNPRYQSSRDR